MGESDEVWMTTNKEAAKFAGRALTIVLSAPIDPADPPITTMSLGCKGRPFPWADRHLVGDAFASAGCRPNTNDPGKTIPPV